MINQFHQKSQSWDKPLDPDAPRYSRVMSCKFEEPKILRGMEKATEGDKEIYEKESSTINVDGPERIWAGGKLVYGSRWAHGGRHDESDASIEKSIGPDWFNPGFVSMGVDLAAKNSVSVNVNVGATRESYQAACAAFVRNGFVSRVDGMDGADGIKGCGMATPEASEQPSKPQYARIIPAKRDKDGPHPTQGTQVMVGDQPLAGVTGITLRADIDGLWTATIECMVKPPEELVAELTNSPESPNLDNVPVGTDITDISDETRRFKSSQDIVGYVVGQYFGGIGAYVGGAVGSEDKAIPRCRYDGLEGLVGRDAGYSIQVEVTGPTRRYGFE